MIPYRIVPPKWPIKAADILVVFGENCRIDLETDELQHIAKRGVQLKSLADGNIQAVDEQMIIEANSVNNLKLNLVSFYIDNDFRTVMQYAAYRRIFIGELSPRVRCGLGSNLLLARNTAEALGFVKDSVERWLI